MSELATRSPSSISHLLLPREWSKIPPTWQVGYVWVLCRVEKKRRNNETIRISKTRKPTNRHTITNHLSWARGIRRRSRLCKLPYKNFSHFWSNFLLSLNWDAFFYFKGLEMEILNFPIRTNLKWVWKAISSNPSFEESWWVDFRSMFSNKFWTYMWKLWRFLVLENILPHLVREKKYKMNLLTSHKWPTFLYT